VLTTFTIFALARPTSSPDHLHHFRLRTPNILAFIASTAAATIASARATAASSFNHPTFAHLTIPTSIASIAATITATIAAIIPAGAKTAAALTAATAPPPHRHYYRRRPVRMATLPANGRGDPDHRRRRQ
jgi:hypothetical protein